MKDVQQKWRNVREYAKYTVLHVTDHNLYVTAMSSCGYDGRFVTLLVIVDININYTSLHISCDKLLIGNWTWTVF